MAAEGRMAVHVGTSGWSYPEWKGSFYPEDLKSDRMLAYYGERFDSVEVNNTFYRLPKREVLEGWAAQVPPGFSFVVKASQRITHRAKLGPDSADPLRYLLETCGALGEKLGPVLFQTPPWLKRDLGVLRDFLALLPAGVRAVEPSALLTLSHTALASLWRQHPNAYTMVVMNIAREISRRLRHADRLIASIHRVVTGLDLDV